MLLHLAPSPAARLHRAIALRYFHGPAAALAEVDTLAEPLTHHHLLHATRAELLRVLDRPADARDANKRALALTENPAERAILRQRTDWN